MNIYLCIKVKCKLIFGINFKLNFLIDLAKKSTRPQALYMPYYINPLRIVITPCAPLPAPTPASGHRPYSRSAKVDKVIEKSCTYSFSFRLTLSSSVHTPHTYISNI